MRIRLQKDFTSSAV